MKAEITLPESLADIKLSDYQKLIEVVQANEGADEFINMKTVQYLCTMPFDLVGKIRKRDFDDILVHLDKVLREQPEFKMRFKLNGIEYGFIPNLDEDMTAGEFADLTNYFDDWKEMHRAMSVLFRPVTKTYKDKYLIEDYAGSNESLKNMPMDIVMGARVFFYHLGIELSQATLQSLEKGSQEEIALRQLLEQNGVGINPFMHSLRETFSILKEQRN